MYKNDTMSQKVKLLARNIRRRIHRERCYREVSESKPFLSSGKQMSYNTAQHQQTDLESCPTTIVTVKFNDSLDDDDDDGCATSPWQLKAKSNRLLYTLRWPLTFFLWCTVPDCRRYNKRYILTFISCALWIGGLSYFVAFTTSAVSGKFCVLDRDLHAQSSHQQIASWE